MFQIVQVREGKNMKRIKNKEKETQLARFVTSKRRKTPDSTFICGWARMFQIVQVRGGRKMKRRRKNHLTRLPWRAVTWKPNENSFPHLVKSREEHHHQAFFFVIHWSGKGNEVGFCSSSVEQGKRREEGSGALNKERGLK